MGKHEAAVQVSEAGDESRVRKLRGPLARAIALIALSYAAFQVYTAWAGAFPNLQQRSIHVGFALVLCFAIYPATRRSPVGRITPLDILLSLLAVVTTGYIVLNSDRIMLNPATSSVLEGVLGTILVVLLLEATRRCVGMGLPVICAVAFLYAYFGAYLPGRLSPGEIGFDYLIEQLYLGDQGVWGLITGLSATMIAMFILFGALLLYTGGGRTFVDLSVWLAGRSQGGAAKVATVASGLFGTVSGSAIANVATVGTFTIPMMKRLGYGAEFAAAVESAASVGGQIMPPIMGAGAFIMAELLGVPYLHIAAAAAIPAVLYYLGCGAAIHFEAGRKGLPKMPREMIPTFRTIIPWPRSGPLAIPVVILLYLMLQGYTPTLAALGAMVAAAVLYIFSSLRPADIAARCANMIGALESGARGLVIVACTIASAQVFIALLNITGLGVKFSEMIIGFSGGNLFVALILAMLVCIVLGAGLPTTPSYLLAAAVTAPALSELGVLPLAAHLFIFYFAVFADISPPVAHAVYVAAAMARTDWVKPAWIACRLALSGFVAPFMFVYAPGLILVGDPFTIVTSAITAAIGIISLSAGAMGYFLRTATLLDRAVLIGAALLLIHPGYWADALGLTLLLAVWLKQKYLGKGWLRFVRSRLSGQADRPGPG